MRKETLGTKCEKCGSTENLCIHHRWSKRHYFALIEFFNSGDCDSFYRLLYWNTVTICKKCHFAFHKGMDLCPNCLKNGVMTYKPHYYPTCSNCRDEKTHDLSRIRHFDRIRHLLNLKNKQLFPSCPECGLPSLHVDTGSILDFESGLLDDPIFFCTSCGYDSGS